MSRRLEEMTDQSLQESSRRADKVIAEAGFSEELKRKLQERIAKASSRTINPQAWAEIDLPAGSGKRIREIAAARPWDGTETTADSVFRMLEDAHKPLKSSRSQKTPSPRVINLDIQRKPPSNPGQRLADARDRSSSYSLTKDSSVPLSEKEAIRQELKDRFSPGARAMPATLQGLSSLANERIEDAIARGQFKNLPNKGKSMERDYNMSNPFLDTTEYFMNKIIQKQEIVPPWIEKQQELVKQTNVFRTRLRVEWRRHAARSIASKGGSLQDQIKRAESYAEAERIAAIKPPAAGLRKGTIEAVGFLEEHQEQPPDPAVLPSPSRSHASLFREVSWEKTEQAYHTLAVKSLNTIVRSYNLMAPSLAQKPYLSLDRELSSCYADVAPQIAQEIRERASRPAAKKEVAGHIPGGFIEKLRGGDSVKVYESQKPHYGFKQLWRDIWA
ncbi:MAG: hypothetical protein M1829_004206 [Trizodia sp. TS-e1964]|nr:MAG: hypothetical protein M1829_004206 [Trizodia sp. TS-e1964]